jgi:hypothetical protein
LYQNVFMRCQSLLLPCLLISLISLPISGQTQTINSHSHNQPQKMALSQSLNPQIIRAYQSISTGIEKRNINQVFAYASSEYSWIDNSGNTRNLQQTIQVTSGFLETTSNIKYFRKIESINYGEQLITVLGTAYIKGFQRPENNSYSREVKFQDTWIRTNNGLKWINQHDLSQNVAWATPKRRQSNSIGQSQSRHDLIQAINLADGAIRGCYEKKKLEECDKLSRIKSTLSTWCQQGDRSACSMLSGVMSSEASTSIIEQTK